LNWRQEATSEKKIKHIFLKNTKNIKIEKTPVRARLGPEI
jgi:hypothetical protein